MYFGYKLFGYENVSATFAYKWGDLDGYVMLFYVRVCMIR